MWGWNRANRFTIHHVVQMFVTTSRRLPPSPPLASSRRRSIYPYDTWQPCQCDPRWEFHYHGHDLYPVLSLPIRVEMELSYSILAIFVLREQIWSFSGQQNCAAKIHFFNGNWIFSKYITSLYIYTHNVNASWN